MMICIDISYSKTFFTEHAPIVCGEIFPLQSIATLTTTKTLGMIWLPGFLWSDGFIFDHSSTLGAVFQEFLRNKTIQPKGMTTKC